MAKANALATALFEKSGAVKEKKEFKESFEVTKPAVMSGFRGMFGEHTLSRLEEERIENLLQEYVQEEGVIEEDCKNLFRLTSEIKAISNQSILLHGERIKRAQDILKKYKEGAFTSWLLTTYGNRQTPYSMLQYYELYLLLPVQEKVLIENLPKKAAYTLASRQGNLHEKIELLKTCTGEKQQEILVRIRKAFPKSEDDRRSRSPHSSLIRELEKITLKIELMKESLSPEEKRRLLAVNAKIRSLL